MIESFTKEKDPKLVRTYTYPILKRKIASSPERSYIVLFIKESFGVVVYSGSDCSYNIGYTADDWDDDDFITIPYYEEIILKNKKEE